MGMRELDAPWRSVLPHVQAYWLDLTDTSYPELVWEWKHETYGLLLRVRFGGLLGPIPDLSGLYAATRWKPIILKGGYNEETQRWHYAHEELEIAGEGSCFSTAMSAAVECFEMLALELFAIPNDQLSGHSRLIKSRLREYIDLTPVSDALNTGASCDRERRRHEV